MDFNFFSFGKLPRESLPGQHVSRLDFESFSLCQVEQPQKSIYKTTLLASLAGESSINDYH